MNDLVNKFIRDLGCLCSKRSVEKFNEIVNFGIENNYESVEDVGEIKESN